jgi:hypothetical protein
MTVVITSNPVSSAWLEDFMKRDSLCDQDVDGWAILIGIKTKTPWP